MLKINWLRILLYTISILFSTSVFANTGNIRGTVTDKRTGETIVGANVYFVGTTTGTTTDFDGKFALNNLKPGVYDLAISFISYKMQVLQGVRVERDRTLELNIALEEESTLLETVTITARRANNTDLSMISAIKASELVVSGVSSQQISRSQDSDASQVMRRIPGIIVVDGRFIMIRGLNERYNYTMLNHMGAPSMETDVRSFSFDILPSSLIDQILIYKSPSPDLPADFAGGVIQILTKGIPDQKSYSASYSSTFRPGSSLENFYNQPLSGIEHLGFNAGTNDLPSDFPKDLRRISDSNRVEFGRSLNNNWVPIETNAGLDHSFSATAGHAFSKGNFKAGNMTAILFSNSKRITDVNRRDYNAYDFEFDRISTIFNFNDQQNRQDIRSGIIHDWAFEWGSNNKVEFKNLFNQLSIREYIYRTGNHFDFGYFADNHSFQTIYRGIYTGQLHGTHKFRNNLSEVDWTTGYSYAYRDEPDYRRYRSDRDTDTDQLTLYIPAGAAAAYFLGRFYSDMQEHNTLANINYTHRFESGKSAAANPLIKTGLFLETKDRDFISRNIGYTRASILGFDQNLTNVSIDSLFHQDNINGTYGIAIDEQSNPSDSYNASIFNTGTYVMGSLPLGDRLKITGGVRAEYNIQTLSSRTLTNDPIEEYRPKLFLLPSANFTYSFTDKNQLKFTYGRSYNRPEFRETAPFGFYDFSFNLVKKGNNNITTADIHNLDLRWEIYPSLSEIITLGAFYKHITGSIVPAFWPGGGSGGIKTFTFANAESSTIAGAEVELRKSLAGLTSSRFIDNFSLIFNGTYIYSREELGEAALAQANMVRPMVGQAPYIVNTGLIYESTQLGLIVSALYNVFGERIYIIGYDDYPDIYEMPRHLLDFTVTKKFGKNLELKLGAADILNNEQILMQDSNQDGIFDRAKDQVIARSKPGMKISAGLSYKF